MAHAEAPAIGPAAAPVLSCFGLGYSTASPASWRCGSCSGIGEAGNFPAAIKTVAEWFPKRERALATGIFNSGTNVGAILTPLAVPWIVAGYGWYWAFVADGRARLRLVRRVVAAVSPPGRSIRASRRRSSHTSAAIRPIPPWPCRGAQIVRHRQAWAFAIGKFLTDPIWWLYLFWIPDFLSRNHGLDLRSMGLPLVTIYLAADVGSVGGGWLSSRLLARGWTVNSARKTAMLVCALAVVPIVFASQVKDLWVAVALVSLAAAAHQGWSANLFTLTSDMFPRPTIASVVGFGGMFGAIGGMYNAKATGYILERHRQLRADLHDCGLGVPDRAAVHPPARAEAGAGEDRGTLRRALSSNRTRSSRRQTKDTKGSELKTVVVFALSSSSFVLSVCRGTARG